MRDRAPIVNGPAPLSTRLDVLREANLAVETTGTVVTDVTVTYPLPDTAGHLVGDRLTLVAGEPAWVTPDLVAPPWEPPVVELTGWLTWFPTELVSRVVWDVTGDFGGLVVDEDHSFAVTNGSWCFAALTPRSVSQVFFVYGYGGRNVETTMTFVGDDEVAAFMVDDQFPTLYTDTPTWGPHSPVRVRLVGSPLWMTP